MPRAGPQNKNYVVQNVNCAEADKSCFVGMNILLGFSLADQEGNSV